MGCSTSSKMLQSWVLHVAILEHNCTYSKPAPQIHQLRNLGRLRNKIVEQEGQKLGKEEKLFLRMIDGNPEGWVAKIVSEMCLISFLLTCGVQICCNKPWPKWAIFSKNLFLEQTRAGSIFFPLVICGDECPTVYLGTTVWIFHAFLNTCMSVLSNISISLCLKGKQQQKEKRKNPPCSYCLYWVIEVEMILH